MPVSHSHPPLVLRAWSALPAALLLAVSLAGCSASKAVYWPRCEPASACKPAGTVVLLPEKGGKPTAVTLESGSSSGVLNHPYQTAEVNAQGSLQLAETNEAEVKRRYPWLLKLRPPEPRSLTVYFSKGNPHLTADSEADLDALLSFVQQWPGSEVHITAHTDTTGSDELNDRLSLERANTLRDQFIGQGLRAELVNAEGKGERDLLVPTADEVDEPRNRRAVITVE